MNHNWLPVVNNLFPGKSLLQTFKKTLVQQLLWNPFIFMPMFYGAYGRCMDDDDEYNKGGINVKAKKHWEWV